MAKEKNKKELTPTQKIEIGVGLTAAAVAAAGAYFLYGSKSASKNRKTIKSWMLKGKAEVLARLEDAKQMTKEEYEDLISTVASSYIGLKNASKAEIQSFTKEMKDHWKEIEKTAKPAKKIVKKVLSTAAKQEKNPIKKSTKTAKKTIKKVVK